MTKRTAEAQRTQAENGVSGALAHLMEPMLAGMTTTRQDLLAWVHAQGLAALDEMFRAEAAALVGAKGRHQTQRTHHHWGTAATELILGGRRVQVRRPRVRQTTGGEATLPSVVAFRNRDPLTARMMQQLLAGVSTREYAGSLEARPLGRRPRGTSKSAVSRAVVRRTRQRLQEQLTRRLDGLQIVALFMDGVVLAQQTVIVVLGITRDGHKEPLGRRLGSTENAVVWTELLQDLLARGLTLDARVLCVIDGGKGLRKALGDVLGDAAVIQRCQLHKGRNLDVLVPAARQAYVRAMLSTPAGRSRRGWRPGWPQSTGSPRSPPGYFAASRGVGAPRFNNAAASLATAVPSKKRGFCVPHSRTALPKTKSWKSLSVMWPSSTSSNASGSGSRMSTTSKCPISEL